jgi:hypothetical protein
VNLKQLEIKIKALVKEASRKTNMAKIAEEAKDMVASRTSRGFGVERPEGKKKRLKPLSPEYKKERRRLKQKGRLSADTTPQKSNLTQSKQMLNSLDTKARDGVATVFLNNGEANEKAKYQAKDGRSFMNLSKTETQKITKTLEDLITNDIRKKGL